MRWTDLLIFLTIVRKKLSKYGKDSNIVNTKFIRHDKTNRLIYLTGPYGQIQL